jgi:hypothetical protein
MSSRVMWRKQVIFRSSDKITDDTAIGNAPSLCDRWRANTVPPRQSAYTIEMVEAIVYTYWIDKTAKLGKISTGMKL